MLNCFEPLDDELLDRASFKCRHRLMGHPALDFANLARVIPALPPKHVMYSVKQLNTADNFEKTFSKRPQDCSIEETLENLRTSDSYVMIQTPEADPSFRDLHRELLADVEQLMHQRGVGKAAVNPHLYLFIASPGSVTPFHLDRYSTFLLQFSGSKKVAVFPQWNEAVVTTPRLEDYVAYHNTSLPLETGDGFAGHHVQLHAGRSAAHPVRGRTPCAQRARGSFKISMSIIFNTEESMRWRHALNFNRAARRRLARVGLSVKPVGFDARRDRVKARVWSMYASVRGINK